MNMHRNSQRNTQPTDARTPDHNFLWIRGTPGPKKASSKENKVVGRETTTVLLLTQKVDASTR
jgi:hypothetical protein